MNGHVPGESSSITAAIIGNNINDEAMIAIFNLKLRYGVDGIVDDRKNEFKLDSILKSPANK